MIVRGSSNRVATVVVAMAVMARVRMVMVVIMQVKMQCRDRHGVTNR